MSTLIDLDAIRGTTVKDEPYRYAVMTETFRNPETSRQLREQFPQENFSLSERLDKRASQKRYRTYDYQLVLHDKRDESRIASLTPLWRQLVDEVTGTAYRDALAELTSSDLGCLQLEARLTRYSPGCWIEPHTDRADKVVTHLMYFNEPWRTEWLGDFRVLRSSDMEDYAERVPPHLGTSVVMVRSERSWHGVPPVQADIPQARMTLLVHFATGA